MSWDNFSNLAVAALGVTATALEVWRRSGGPRSSIKANLELMELLPADSPARANLLKHIESQVAGLIDREVKTRRDPTGTALSLIFLVAALWSAAGAWETSGLSRWVWIALAISFGAFGGVGLSQDGIRRERDEKGNPVKPIRSSS